MTITYREAFQQGWEASRRSKTFDLDAAEARFEKKHGTDTETAFAAGWTAHATGEHKTAQLAWTCTAPDRWFQAVESFTNRSARDEKAWRAHCAGIRAEEDAKARDQALDSRYGSDEVLF